MSFEQAVVRLEQTNAALQEEVIRFRDAAMGLNNIWPTTTEGRQNTADGKYFSVPGNGAYMRLYRRTGSSASLIAEFPDRAQVQSLVDTLGGRGVTNGLLNLGQENDLVRLSDAIFAARAKFGIYYSPSAGANIDEAPAGDCGLYSSGGLGVYPPSNDSFYWVETQPTFSGNALVQRACVYSSSASTANLRPRSFIRICSNTLSGEGKRIWGPWAENYTSQNILGTVSHVNGKPSGAIIETGENVNGRFIKFAGGWAICTMNVLFSYNSNLYQYNNFPLAFLEAPALSKSHSGVSADIYRRWAYVEAGAGSVDPTSRFTLLFRTDFNSALLADVTETIRVTAIGRYAIS